MQMTDSSLNTKSPKSALTFRRRVTMETWLLLHPGEIGERVSRRVEGGEGMGGDVRMIRLAWFSHLVHVLFGGFTTNPKSCINHTATSNIRQPTSFPRILCACTLWEPMKHLEHSSDIHTKI